ncbi:MAG: VWA domain-containing protein [Deltaproteobacteria bacterium]|nr:MAG: VWA domain-containing protein [Deltaproteobacteria bacterium]
MTATLLALLLASLAIREGLAFRRSDSHLLRRNLPRRLAYDLLTLAALALLLIPVPTEKPGDIRGDLALAFVVDVSRSMAADAGGVSRLDRARQDMARNLRRAEGADIAMVAFGGQPVVLSPTTRDSEAIRLLVDALEPGLVAAPGSAPEEAVLLARQLLPETGSRHILLYSDGERTWPEAPPNLPTDIPVTALLPGPDTEAPVPGRDDAPALTRPDRKRLGQIAEQTGGRFLRLDGRTPGFEAIPELASTGEGLRDNRDRLSIWLAFALLLARGLPLAARRHAAALAGLVLLVFAGCDPTTEGEDAAELFRQAAGMSPSADSTALFEKAAVEASGELKATALHNACSDALVTDDPRRALRLCRNALLVRPGLTETVTNYALALRRSADLPAGAGPDGTAEEHAGDSGMTANEAQTLLDGLEIRPGGHLPPGGRPRPLRLEKDW